MVPLSNLIALNQNISVLQHYDLKAGLGLECDHQDYWTSHEISMDHLQEVELSGLTGTDCELWFMKAVLTSAKGLRKVAVRLAETWLKVSENTVLAEML